MVSWPRSPRRHYEYDVRVILPEDQRSTIADLTTMLIQTPTGQLVTLSLVAELEQIQSPTMIQRENQQTADQHHQ